MILIGENYLWLCGAREQETFSFKSLTVSGIFVFRARVVPRWHGSFRCARECSCYRKLVDRFYGDRFPIKRPFRFRKLAELSLILDAIWPSITEEWNLKERGYFLCIQNRLLNFDQINSTEFIWSSFPVSCELMFTCSVTISTFQRFRFFVYDLRAEISFFKKSLCFEAVHQSWYICYYLNWF